MNDEDLDRCYTALCEALARVGEPRTPQLLAMLSLALMAQQPDAEAVLALICKVEADSD